MATATIALLLINGSAHEVGSEIERRKSGSSCGRRLDGARAPCPSDKCVGSHVVLFFVWMIFVFTPSGHFDCLDLSCSVSLLQINVYQD